MTDPPLPPSPEQRPPAGADPGVGDLAGRTIAGRYRVLRKLGEGAMGAVYLAEHIRMGRRDAIKVISRTMAGNPEALARFEREARNASFINHPHVCQIYDFGETEDGLAFLAMEFVEGETLGAILAREGGRLPVERAIRIILQAAEALEAAHARDIVHRDLKPDNIMLTLGLDGSDSVKVVDFGIAKGIGDDEGQAVTRLGFVVGTPEYMSPEQLSGDRLDGRSDVYSLALVLVRILTGSFPFSASSSQELMLKRLTEEPRPLAELAPGVAFPSGLQGVLDRALARRREDRHPTAGAFRQQLSAVLEAASAGGGGAFGAGPPVLPPTRVEPAAGPSAGAGFPVPWRPAGASGAWSRLPLVLGGTGVLAALVLVTVLLVRGGGGEAAISADPARAQGGSPPPDPFVLQPDAGGGDPGEAVPSPRGPDPAPERPGDPTGGDRPSPLPAPPIPVPAISVTPEAALDLLFQQTDRLDALNARILGTEVPGPEVIRDHLARGGAGSAELRAAMLAARDTLEAILEAPGVAPSIRAQAAWEAASLLRATPGSSRDRILALLERAVQLDPDSDEFRRALQAFRSGGAR